MSLIDDFRTAIDHYATANCKTEIVNFAITSGGGSYLDVGETFQFKVKVTNQSHLDMKNVTLQALGSAYADVALSTGTFGSNATSSAFSLNALDSHTTGYFRGKAKAATSGAQDIVSARIKSWDASLDHLLRDHSNQGAAEAKLHREVRPE